MRREWKPGDVAMVTYSRSGLARVMLRGNNDKWWEPSGYFRDEHARGARPLVVIDPEDVDVAQVLAHAYDSRAMGPSSGVDMQAALRSLVAPPKPEEPTGLGAVVEDTHEVEYIHIGSGLWVYGTTDGPSKGFTYAAIDAVKVLSEGVTQ